MVKRLQRLFLLPRLILTCMDVLRVCYLQTHSCIVDQSSLLGKPEFLLRYKICRLGLLQRFSPNKSCLICLLQFLYSLLCSTSRKANKASSSSGQLLGTDPLTQLLKRTTPRIGYFIPNKDT